MLYTFNPQKKQHKNNQTILIFRKRISTLFLCAMTFGIIIGNSNTASATCYEQCCGPDGCSVTCVTFFDRCTPCSVIPPVNIGCAILKIDYSTLANNGCAKALISTSENRTFTFYDDNYHLTPSCPPPAGDFDVNNPLEIELPDGGYGEYTICTQLQPNAGMECHNIGASFLPCCDLEVDCAGLVGGMAECIDEIEDRTNSIGIIDACGSTSISFVDEFHPTSNFCNLAIVNRKYTITDDNGTPSDPSDDKTEVCRDRWEIGPPDAPTIICPAGMPVECFADIVVNADDAVVTTSCNLGTTVEVSDPLQDGPSDCPGTTYTYTYTVTDDCGRTASCDQIFTIENDPPTIMCPAGMPVECFADIVVNADNAVVTASCSLGTTVEVSDPVQDGPSDCPGTTYTYTYTVTDDCGRTASCDQVFTIQNDAPMITYCPEDRTVECWQDIEAEPQIVEYTASCNLEVTVSSSRIFAPYGFDNCPGTLYYIDYEIEDACGRTDDCRQYFRIENEAPRVFPSSNFIIACRAEIEGRVSLDDCQIEASCDLEIIHSEIMGPIEEEDVPDCQNGKLINYIYSATDECGRMTCVVQTFLIRHDGLAFYPSPEDLTIPCGEEIPEIYAGYNGCGSVPITTVDDTTRIDATNSYLIERTISAEDVCGNSISASYQITLEDCIYLCTETEDFWGNKFAYNADSSMTSAEILANLISTDDPITLGVEGRSLTVASKQCVCQILPGHYNEVPSAFPENTGDVVIGFAGMDCTIAPIPQEELGMIRNGLAAQTLTLMLNLRWTSLLNDILVSEICIEVSDEVLNALGGNGTVADLSRLANQALGGNYTHSHSELMDAIRAVNEHFEGCNVKECIDPASQAGDRNNEEESSLLFVENQLELVPNPADEQVNVFFNVSGASKAQLRIFSTTGTIVYTKEMSIDNSKQTHEVDIADLPMGYYVVSIITDNNEMLSKKLLKIKR